MHLFFRPFYHFVLTFFVFENSDLVFSRSLGKYFIVAIKNLPKGYKRFYNSESIILLHITPILQEPTQDLILPVLQKSLLHLKRHLVACRRQEKWFLLI